MGHMNDRHVSTGGQVPEQSREEPPAFLVNYITALTERITQRFATQ